MMTSASQSPAPGPPGSPGPPGPIELVAMDVDGTLLRNDKRLSRRNVQAIQAAVKKGVHVVLATARPPRTMREIYQLLGLSTLQINYNGALILDPATGTAFHHEPLSLEVGMEVIACARHCDPDVVVSVEILDKWYTDRLDGSLPTETSVKFQPDFVGPLHTILTTPVTKVMLLAPAVRLGPVHAQVRSRFAGRVAIGISDLHLIQVTHPAVEKSLALERIAAHYGVARERVMAIGDAPNDAAMLRWAGLGVAVANAWEPTRAAANVMVASNDDNGVAEAFNRFVL